MEFNAKEQLAPIYNYLEEHPGAYFAVLAGGRLWVYNPDAEYFSAHDDSRTQLTPDDPLLRTEIMDGIEVCPLLKFDSIDELLDFISGNDIQKCYFDAIHNIAYTMTQNMQLANAIHNN